MNAHRNGAGGQWWRAIALLAATACIALCPAEAAYAAVGDLVLVADTGERDYGEVNSIQYRPAISADGRFVAFGSTSSNISPEVTTHQMAFYRFQSRR